MEIITDPTAADVQRLLAISAKISGRRHCDMHEAIDWLDRIVDVGVAETSSSPRASIGKFAESVRKLHARRNAALGTTAFRDAAWAMLLELLAARHAGQEICVTSLCHGVGAPYATALRYAERLAADGLIEKHADHQDHRRTLVRLTDRAAAQLEALLIALQDSA